MTATASEAVWDKLEIPGDIELTALANKMLKILDRLPNQRKQRDIAVAIMVEGLSYEQCAERFDLSVSAVKSMLWRARRKLQEYL
jgi:RNA polymerase sigma factor (sigma-70 family)